MAETIDGILIVIETPIILVINPNSSKVVTSDMRKLLRDHFEGYALSYYTAPPNGPESINDTTSSVLSAALCLPELMQYFSDDLHAAFLVACFSDHPLAHMIREHTTKPVLSIFEAAISHSLLVGMRFGIVTTGTPWIARLTDGVRMFMGAGNSERFVGVEATGLGVLQLHDGGDEVQEKIKRHTKILVNKGADTIVLGCAGEEKSPALLLV